MTKFKKLKIIKIFLLIISQFIIILLIFPQTTRADVSKQSCKQDSDCKAGVCFNGTCALFKPEISIPGLDYKSLQPDYSTKPIAEYINAIYQYLIRIVGIISAVVLMIGGVIWIMAGGSSEQIGEAKNWIGASLLGLIIAISAYSILNTINPALVNFKITKIQNVEALGCCELTNGGCLPSTNASDCPKSKGRFVKGGPFSCNRGKCIQDMGGCCVYRRNEIYQNDSEGCYWVSSKDKCVSGTTDTRHTYEMGKKCNTIPVCLQYGSKCDGMNDGIKSGTNEICWDGYPTKCVNTPDTCTAGGTICCEGMCCNLTSWLDTERDRCINKPPTNGKYCQ